MSVQSPELDTVQNLAPKERVEALILLGERALDSGADRDAVVAALVGELEAGTGAATGRVGLGEILGKLGDPRLRTPADEEYWALVPGEDGDIVIGRYLVTNGEYQSYVDAGGYEPGDHWGKEGRAWLDTVEDSWPVRAAAADVAQFVVPNQPVVGVSWHEAAAYARFHGGRLPRFDERLWVVRGEERRPYPWGAPFGTGNANTKEEVIGRPTAVGLFRNDRTPEGVYDLAGNVGEWTEDGVGDDRWIHPGAWDQPSMAAWAKAREFEPVTSRWGGLGFRLARGQ